MPRLLDLCCGAGGTGEGYRRAGFDVTGVDHRKQPHYQAGEFVLADAVDYLMHHGAEYDAIHVSPPCQGYSQLQTLGQYDPAKYPMMIDLFRAMLDDLNKPYIIENVERARKHMANPFRLCGEMFGLKTYRHRLFESNLLIFAPPHPTHPEACPPAGQGPSTVHGYFSVAGDGGSFNLPDGVSYMEYASMAMGIDWPVTRVEVSQMIPPAYTEWIGRQLILSTN